MQKRSVKLGLLIAIACMTNLLLLGACGRQFVGQESHAPADVEQIVLQEDATNSSSEGQVEPSTPTESLSSILYMGQASLRIVTPEGAVIYIDPYAGDGYDLPADLILVTHAHFDHNGLDRVVLRNDDCRVVTQDDAVVDGTHQTFDFGFATVFAVQAGFNAYHDVGSCVGYVIELTNGIKVYVTGDTSTTDDMRNGTLAAMDIDYAFWCCDGVFKTRADRAGTEHGRLRHRHPGLPNWWTTMPMAVCTFLEGYDFSGKTICPLITHGGSGFSDSLDDIARLCPDAHIAPGLAVNGDDVQTCDHELEAWLGEIGLL